MWFLHGSFVPRLQREAITSAPFGTHGGRRVINKETGGMEEEVHKDLWRSVKWDAIIDCKGSRSTLRLTWLIISDHLLRDRSKVRGRQHYITQVMKRSVFVRVCNAAQHRGPQIRDIHLGVVSLHGGCLRVLNPRTYRTQTAPS